MGILNSYTGYECEVVPNWESQYPNTQSKCTLKDSLINLVIIVMKSEMGSKVIHKKKTS